GGVGSGRQVGRPGHRAPAGTGGQPLGRPGPALPVLLRPQDDVRQVHAGVRVHPRRVRHARRVLRGHHAGPDGQDHQVPDRAAGRGLLEPAGRLDPGHAGRAGHDLGVGHGAVPGHGLGHRLRRVHPRRAPACRDDLGAARGPVRRGAPRRGAHVSAGAGRWVCVYCASSTYDPGLLDLADSVGTGIARRGWSLVSGGGNVSMMGSVAEAARRGGARTVGLIPEGLRAREVADTDADELVVVTTMRERKREMEERSDAFLALPGGIGTLEEMFEAWTAASLGFHHKPVVLYDPVGFYAPLLDWVRGMAATGLVQPHALDCLVVCEDLESALD